MLTHHDVIEGARVLDLFAGTGALGFEALSRGAAAVTFVDRSETAARAIQGHLDDLGATGAEVVRAEAHGYLHGAAQPFDIVFLDPPFGEGQLPGLCTLLDAGGWLAPAARVAGRDARRRLRSGKGAARGR